MKKYTTCHVYSLNLVNKFFTRWFYTCRSLFSLIFHFCSLLNMDSYIPFLFSVPKKLFLHVRVFFIGLTTLSCKKTFVTETATCNLQESSVQNEPLESMPLATVNAESENPRNSAGNRIRMTDSGQSRKEAAVMTTGAVSAKTTTLIGFWNVRTMYEQGRMAQVIAEMKHYKLRRTCK